MSSPYKKFKQTARHYVGFRGLNNFDENVAYKLYDIQATEHPQFGPGQCVFVLDAQGKKWRVQLPGNDLKQLDVPKDIDFMMNDIKEGNPPLLVYRGTEIESHFKNATMVPKGDDDEEAEEGTS